MERLKEWCDKEKVDQIVKAIHNEILGLPPFCVKLNDGCELLANDDSGELELQHRIIVQSKFRSLLSYIHCFFRRNYARDLNQEFRH